MTEMAGGADSAVRDKDKDKDKGILEYWNQAGVESMYDKHLLNAEIQLLARWIPEHSKVLDAGCGEGEGTVVYAAIPGAVVHGADFSDTRLKLARERLHGKPNVSLQKVDFLNPCGLPSDYDVVVSQRFLINIPGWDKQQGVLSYLLQRLKQGGRLALLEGCHEGVAELNEFRVLWGLPPIPVKWHNYFLRDNELKTFMRTQGARLQREDGLGAYFMLTRGVRPIFDRDLGWDCEYNRAAATEQAAALLGLGARFSRLKLWVFEK